VTDHDRIFLSYSRNDPQAAANLRAQLEKSGLSVFKDDQSIREGDLWLERLQEAVDACTGFVVLVGRDGVRRWTGAETQAALSRYFGPKDAAERLPIFPILLGDTSPESLPAFLRLFQSTPWNGTDPLPEQLLDQIRERTILPSEAAIFKGCPFVGLDAFRMDQAQLFFGRQKETLDALACFDTRPGSPTARWLEISGNSGSGKSSLMNAGLLPLVDQGWLWPRTGYEHWLRIGPMMPGEHPVTMLAEHLARSFGAEMADVRQRLQTDDDQALTDWLRGRKQENAAFFLAIDQFEELFTFADSNERGRFDRLLAAALEDVDCPLLLMTTVRADFLDRFETLPRLLGVRNRSGRNWTLPPIGEDGLREVIAGPAQLAALDVSEIQEAMIADALGEMGALPLVENALHWLWEKRHDNRLSGKRFNTQGGLAGILSHNADDLLRGLGDTEKERALALLFRLVKVDLEGQRHTRRRIPLTDAVTLAGDGEAGRNLVDHLAGKHCNEGGRTNGPLRLITIAEEHSADSGTRPSRSWVDLIHETLIRSRDAGAAGGPQPYWPTLWDYIESHKGDALSIEGARLLAWRIEYEARKWDNANRDERLRWSELQIREALLEFKRAGGPLSNVIRSDVARAFLGPADPGEFPALLAGTKAEDTAKGTGRYGHTWHLPLTHQARVILGERLDYVGDNRPGVGLRPDRLPDIAWCPIKGRDVTLQLGDDPMETFTRRVLSFEMARYPVTTVQFRAFFEDCYRDKRWKLPPGFPEHRMTAEHPVRWANRNNHAVNSVNWWDAAAFCHWLSVQLNCTIRLPTEFEWQLAATGGDPERIFPWGAQWDPWRESWRANTAESGLARAVAVGLYPNGASPDGVLDMAGSLWEWCLNRYNVADNIGYPAGERDAYVLRGGSWFSDWNLARSTVRGWGYPDNRISDVGFRVIRSSPIADC